MISLGAREEDIFSKPTAGKSQWLIRWGLFLLALLPVLIVSSVSYKTQKETLTHEVFSRRQEIAHLSAMLVKERFDRLVDIGVSFATRNRLSEYLEQNQWQEAIQMVRHLPEKMPFIERIFLTDPAGTEMADLPELEGAVGKNFAHRDWFLGVTRSHKPYVSEIYQRAAAPQHNVVAVAIPILSEESAVLGILVMQLKLDVFYDWARSISVGPGGHIFFMDPKGHVAAHPQFPAQGPIVDFSKVPAIRRVLSRQRGLEIIYNPIEKEERITAYEKIPEYLWTAVVQEPTRHAFLERDQELKRLLFFFGIIFVVNAFFAWVIALSVGVIAKRERRERILLESIGDGVFALNLDRRIFLWNRAAERLTGWSKKDTLGRPFREVVRFVSGRTHLEDSAFIDEALRSGKVTYLGEDMVLVGKEGKEVPVMDTAAPILDLDSRVKGVVVIFQDMTERVRAETAVKKAYENLEEKVRQRTRDLLSANEVLKNEIAQRRRMEKELQDSEQRYASMINDAPDPIVTLDTMGFVRAVNPQALQASGYAFEDLLDKHFIKLGIIEAASLPKTVHEFSLVSAGKKRAPFEITVIKKDKSHIVFEAHAQAHLHGGRVSGMHIIFRDISQRKHLEEQVRQAQKMEAVGRLAGGVAHDFNNLLTVVNGFSKLLLAKLLPEDPAKKDLEEILKAGLRAARLVSQLLAFSRRQIFQPKFLDLNNLVGGMDSMFRRMVPENIQVNITLAAGLGVVKADPAYLEQVLANLVVNAGDAMPDGGKIFVETKNITLGEEFCREHQWSPPGEYVMVSVSDTGIGITDEIKKHLFEPFFTTKEKGKGTGLGLATSYGIVKQSGGHIDVYSELGVGSTFKIYLPRVYEKAESSEETLSVSKILPMGSETILLVEDDMPILSFVSRLLRDLGYTVLTAPQGREALKIAETHQGQVDLLITDIIMPVMGGRELAMKLKRNNALLRVVFISGYNEAMTVDGSKLEPMEVFLQKPFAPDILANTVRDLLDKKETRNSQ